ncbi:unnamed protein product [Acanthosepion pharaonis]|uniref:Uncharacterized protein n=1 Tax=Acanthosepion pharaonis TaxID=158019 RepID=A0A812D6Q7_ACAPH|nr:unnamed protein product [Sepia pharaonis]
MTLPSSLFTPFIYLPPFLQSPQLLGCLWNSFHSIQVYYESLPSSLFTPSFLSFGIFSLHQSFIPPSTSHLITLYFRWLLFLHFPLSHSESTFLFPPSPLSRWLTLPSFFLHHLSFLTLPSSLFTPSTSVGCLWNSFPPSTSRFHSHFLPLFSLIHLSFLTLPSSLFHSIHLSSLPSSLFLHPPLAVLPSSFFSIHLSLLTLPSSLFTPSTSLFRVYPSSLFLHPPLVSTLPSSFPPSPLLLNLPSSLHPSHLSLLSAFLSFSLHPPLSSDSTFPLFLHPPLF